jgi:hypothetical protein
MKKWPWSAKEIEIISDLYFLWKKYREYENDRTKSNFDKCLTIFTIMRGLKENQYKGQTKSEFEKNYKRVADIIEKSAGDEEKAIRLAQTQANRITDEFKALNRSFCAKSLYQEKKDKIYHSIFEVFFNRAYELGSVSKQDYRSYKLEKLGI